MRKRQIKKILTPKFISIIEKNYRGCYVEKYIPRYRSARNRIKKKQFEKIYKVSLSDKGWKCQRERFGKKPRIDITKYGVKYF